MREDDRGSKGKNRDKRHKHRQCDGQIGRKNEGEREGLVAKEEREGEREGGEKRQSKSRAS